MWQHYFQPQTLSEALELLREHAGQCRIVAGSTDVLVELGRGIRPASVIIDITKIGELAYLRAEGGVIRLGALATHNDVLASKECQAGALPLVQACAEVGAPQIRARATVAGNLVTASPANDTIAPLLALGAELLLASADGERALPLDVFYTGVRRTQLQPGELVREVRFPALRANQRGVFRKLGLRRAQAISVVNLAIVLTFSSDERVENARIALGSVGPTVLRAAGAEAFLAGRALDATTCAEAGRLAAAAATPIDDLRGSAGYRTATVAALVAEALAQLGAGEAPLPWQGEPVLLELTGDRQQATGESPPGASSQVQSGTPIHTIRAVINGEERVIEGAAGKTLLDALRDNLGLSGSKLGCGEGECGACTVWIDGQAAMACLVPAPQANGASITTIEGLAEEGDGRRTTGDSGQEGNGRQATGGSSGEVEDGDAGPAPSPFPLRLSPLQRAFIERGAVQCGYCIPGMLMAGAALLREHPRPTRAQIQQAISGNICRCTGYRKIVEAIQAAAQDPETREGQTVPSDT
jgi:carbon-monoxide dehydrogenase medium subunit